MMKQTPQVTGQKPFLSSQLTNPKILQLANGGRFTTDRSLQNSSSAIIFHMPNLHWENYSYPEYRLHTVKPV